MNETLHEMIVNAVAHPREFFDGTRIARLEKRRKAKEGSRAPVGANNEDPRNAYKRAAWWLGWSWEMHRLGDTTPEFRTLLKSVAEESLRRRHMRQLNRVSKSEKGL